MALWTHQEYPFGLESGRKIGCSPQGECDVINDAFQGVLMRLLLLFGALALPGWAQSVESIPFRAVLSPREEVPALSAGGGTATVWLRVVRDAQGRVTAGTVEFAIRYDLGGAAVTMTGLHVHRGGRGVNGPIVLDSGLGTPVASTAGTVALRVPVVAGVADEVIANPAGFYVNLHTSANPNGAMRGQLIAADKLVFLTRVTPENVLPPVTGLDARGVAAVTLLGARDEQGLLTCAEIFFDLDYTGFPGDTRFTGLHVHAGGRDVRGPATINATLASPTPGVGGAGSLRYAAEIDLNDVGQFNTVTGLYQNPQLFYADLHTAANPGGAIRGQLLRADTASFSLSLLPRNEVPAVDADASAEAGLTLHALRSPEGAAVAGLAEFDVHPRFSAGTAFTGLHVHNGVAGANGPVTIDSGIRMPAPPAGSDGLFERAVIQTPVSVAALDSVLRNPALHYLNLHTSAQPGGAVRAQLAPAESKPPLVNAVISAVWDPELRRTARGGLFTVFGAQLTKVAGMATGTENDRVPVSLNGTSVSIGGRAAPVLQATSGYVIAQAPVDAPLGPQSVRVTTGNGQSNAVPISVEASAPGIFFDAVTARGKHAAVVKQDRLLRFSAVTASNPARPGDVLLFYGTGFGVTNVQPPETGVLPLGQTGPRVAVIIGGRPAPVLYSVFAPGLAGLNQVAVTMPVGAGAGVVSLVVRVGAASSSPLYFEALMR